MERFNQKIIIDSKLSDTDTDNFIFFRNCTKKLHGYIQNE